VIEDQVQGRVVWQNENLDLVLLRSDGNPTYMLAVSDDHDMGVTHVIRGDDHLINAARQKHIYDAMGWRVPVMAHIPLIHGPDGSKLQAPWRARRRSLSRAWVSAGGAAQLPRPSRLEPWRSGNLLHRGDDTGVRPSAIGRSAARFDFAKLENINGHYIRSSDDRLAGSFRGRASVRSERGIHPRQAQRHHARAASGSHARP
jgi:glutamyl-tRNA synthetase